MQHVGYDWRMRTPIDDQQAEQRTDAHPAHDAPASDERLFSATLCADIRARFAHVDKAPDGTPRVYMENAGGSLKVRRAVEVAADVAMRPDNAGRANPGSREVEALIAGGREDAALFLGAASGLIVSDQSTTANVFRVVEAAVSGQNGGRNPRQNIVTTQLEHPCTHSATKYYAQQHGLEWRVAPIVPGTGELTARAVADRVDANTSAVAFIHASNVIGTRVDAAAVCRAIKQKNPDTLVLLDGTQHAPHGPVDVEALGVDAYCFAPYKTFSVLGTCFVWLSERLADHEHPRLTGLPLNKWELGTRDPAAFAAWSAVVDYLVWLSGEAGEPSGDRRQCVVAAMNAIERHEAALTRHVLRGFESTRGLRLFGMPEADDRREAVFAITIEGLSAPDLVAGLQRHGVVVHDRRHDVYNGHVLDALEAPDCVRVSLAHYNTIQDCDALLAGLRDVSR